MQAAKNAGYMQTHWLDNVRIALGLIAYALSLLRVITAWKCTEHKHYPRYYH
jgi:hypothetical protein